MSRERRTVLLVSASIGAGHTQAARAIQTAWQSRFPGDSVIITDFMDERNSHLNHAIKETYLKMIDVTPFLYDSLYHLSQGLRPASPGQSLFSWFMKKTMLRILATHRPDVVICTHPFPCAAMAYLKRHRLSNALLAGVITDFAVHSTWVYPEVNMYTVAAEEMRGELLRHNIAADRIAVTGIPIQPPFSDGAEIVFDRLGLKQDLPIVLLMGGGLGLGRLQEVALALDSVTTPLQIVAVAGKNSALLQELSQSVKNLSHSAVVLGYTTLVRELMQAASLLITKPGALTLSEAMAAGVPLLLYKSVPGQEADNASFLIGKGAAAWFQAGQPEMIDRLLDDSLERKQMLAAIRRVARADSADAATKAIASRLAALDQVSGL